MKASDVFRSRYLKAADLGTRSPLVTIKAVSRQDFDGGPRLVLGFHETERLLSLNATNGRALIAAFGDETSAWVGKAIRLTVLPVDYRGTQVPAIRVAAAEAPAPPPKAADPFGGLGDGPDF